jgi:hypothetical protein
VPPDVRPSTLPPWRPETLRRAKQPSMLNSSPRSREALRTSPAIFAFLANYTYTLGADQLTLFGQQEMVASGITFYKRYQNLTKDFTPFFRSSGEARVVESAENFTQGVHQSKDADNSANCDDNYPYPILIISEAPGVNNTLSHSLCTAIRKLHRHQQHRPRR